MKNAIFLVVLGILLCGLGFSTITVSITSPTDYSSPDLSFNAITNVQSSAGTYITEINLSVLDLNNVVQATYPYTNSNTSIQSINYTFPITATSGNYRINVSVANNISQSNSSMVEIYPRNPVSQNNYYCTPPSYTTKYIHSNGQNFYILPNNNTYLTNLGLGQMMTNYDMYMSGGVGCTGEVVTLNANQNTDGKYLDTSFRISNNVQFGGTTYNIYRTFKFNLTGTKSYTVNFTNISLDPQVAMILNLSYYIKVNSTTYTIYSVRQTSSAVINGDSINCRINSSGIYCNNSVNFNVSIGTDDIIVLRLDGIFVSSATCAGGQNFFKGNLIINNIFLASYSGYPKGIGNQYDATSNLVVCPLMNGTTVNVVGAPTTSAVMPSLWTSDMINRTGTNITNPQPTVRILMYYNNQIIYPYLYYAIVMQGKTNSESTMGIYNPNIFMPSTTQINSYNNSVIYIYSREYSSWFLIPPFDLNPSGIYIVNLVYDTGIFGVGQNGTNQTGYTVISAVPELPVLEMCNELNGTYYITSEYQTTKTFQVNTWVNNTFYANITSATQLHYQTPTNNYSAIQFYVSGYKRCEWFANQTGLAIQGVDLRPDMLTTNIFFDVGLMLLVALATISPAILLPAMAYNDFFSIIPISQMAFLTIFVAIVSYIVNWYGNRNMKTLLCLVAMGLAMLTYFSIGSGIGYNMQYSSAYGNSSITVASIDADIKQLSVVSQSGINWNSLAQLVYTGIALIIDLLAFIIQIPALLFGVVLGLMFNLSPPLASAVSFFVPYLLIGLIGWLVLKAYDMFQKPYMPT